MDGKSFYLLNDKGKVIESRRKITISNQLKYVIDSKTTGSNYVTKNDFYTVPYDCQLVKFA